MRESTAIVILAAIVGAVSVVYMLIKEPYILYRITDWVVFFIMPIGLGIYFIVDEREEDV